MSSEKGRHPPDRILADPSTIREVASSSDTDLGPTSIRWRLTLSHPETDRGLLLNALRWKEGVGLLEDSSELREPSAETVSSSVGLDSRGMWERYVDDIAEESLRRFAKCDDGERLELFHILKLAEVDDIDIESTETERLEVTLCESLSARSA